jgi:hypothetical protein
MAIRRDVAGSDPALKTARALLFFWACTMLGCAGGAGGSQGEGGPGSSASSGRATTGLERIMKTQVAPAMKELIGWIEGHPEADAGERYRRIQENAELLSRRASEIPEFEPRLHADRRHNYDNLAFLLRASATGLSQSAAEKDPEAARMWLAHLKNTCVDCHRIYRTGETIPLGKFSR